jgi:hypothetical protein
MSPTKSGDMQSRDEYLARRRMVLSVPINMFLSNVDLVCPA